MFQASCFLLGWEIWLIICFLHISRVSITTFISHNSDTFSYMSHCLYPPLPSMEMKFIHTVEFAYNVIWRDLNILPISCSLQFTTHFLLRCTVHTSCIYDPSCKSEVHGVHVHYCITELYTFSVFLLHLSVFDCSVWYFCTYLFCSLTLTIWIPKSRIWNRIIWRKNVL